MKNVTVTPEQFEKAVYKALAEYGDKVAEISEQAAKTAARGTVKELKASAPTGGGYASGWSHKAQKNGITKFSDTVYNRTDYHLTNLLEKPHSTGPHRGGHYPKHVDYTGTMASADEEYSNKYMEEVLSKL